MREQQDTKGGGLMIIISKEQHDKSCQNNIKRFIHYERKSESFKVTIILVYLSVIRNEVEKKNQSVLK